MTAAKPQQYSTIRSNHINNKTFEQHQKQHQKQVALVQQLTNPDVLHDQARRLVAASTEKLYSVGLDEHQVWCDGGCGGVYGDVHERA